MTSGYESSWLLETIRQISLTGITLSFTENFIKFIRKNFVNSKSFLSFDAFFKKRWIRETES